MDSLSKDANVDSTLAVFGIRVGFPSCDDLQLRIEWLNILVKI